LIDISLSIVGRLLQTDYDLMVTDLTQASSVTTAVSPSAALVSHGVPQYAGDSAARLLAEAAGSNARIGETVRVTPMPGGASTRRYFRLVQGDASFVLMYVPDGPTPEEFDKAGVGARWPFLEVGELLASRGVQVPRVFGEDTRAGILLLEDLQENTLAEWLKRTPQDMEYLYTAAVTDLARAQHSLTNLPSDSVVAKRAFDEDLLYWEIDHFREWGLDARKIAMTPADASLFAEIGKRLAKRIAAMPRGFVHRDYQSRNLMVRDRALVWIDFQDALLGPQAYDLVALLGDSYQSFSAAFIDARLRDYALAANLTDLEEKNLREAFWYVTVQRKLKDAGRFVFIDRVKNNPNFLGFVSKTIGKVGIALGHLQSDPDMQALEGLLARYVDRELRDV
jgi:N-acetylmuramate 1-kinase